MLPKPDYDVGSKVDDNPHEEGQVEDNVSGHTDVTQVETCGVNSASRVEHNGVSECSSFKLRSLPKEEQNDTEGVCRLRRAGKLVRRRNKKNLTSSRELPTSDPLLAAQNHVDFRELTSQYDDSRN